MRREEFGGEERSLGEKGGVWKRREGRSLGEEERSLGEKRGVWGRGEEFGGEERRGERREEERRLEERRGEEGRHGNYTEFTPCMYSGTQHTQMGENRDILTLILTYIYLGENRDICLICSGSNISTEIAGDCRTLLLRPGGV